MNTEEDNRSGGAAATGSSMKQGQESRSGQTSGATGMTGETGSSVGGAARQAEAQAQDTASSLRSRAKEQARKMADQQLTMGAEVVADVADAVRAAAERLDRNEPQIAHLAHGAAETLDDVCETIRGQSAEELWHASADFARRHPAALFGATAGLGFLLFRLLKPGHRRSYTETTGSGFGMENSRPRGGPNYGA